MNIEIDENGKKTWLNEAGEIHRVDGPAVEYASGSKHWYLNGERHREDGPAVEAAGGNKYWYIAGEHHREDGPAVIYADGSKYWYLYGEEQTITHEDSQWEILKAKLRKVNESCLTGLMVIKLGI